MTMKRLSLVLVSAAILVLTLVFFIGFFYSEDHTSDEYHAQPPAMEQNLGKPAAPEQDDSGESFSITGQMTLADIEGSSGVAATEIINRLNLPPDTSRDEALGRLRQSYPFTIDQVRNVVFELSQGVDTPESSVGVEPLVNGKEQVASHDEEPQLTRGRGAEDQTGVIITGQMTLREIESQSRVSARAIAQRLGLPPQASLDMPLGRLRRLYRFTMQDVKSIVSDLLNNAKTQTFDPQTTPQSTVR